MTRIVDYAPGSGNVGATTVAIGVFDGVHLGHQALVRDTIAYAREAGVASCVLTFDRDPDRVVDPDHAAPQLLSLDDKVELLCDLGPDSLVVIPFDVVLASLAPERFLADVLLDVVQPTLCVVGHDFRFGNAARGDVETLRAFGAEHGFDVQAHELVEFEGSSVTSSRIRQAVAAGDVRAAAAMLGRPHRLDGRVVRGKGVGRRLGAPTANLHVEHGSAVPAPGIYAATAAVGTERYAAGVFIGSSPTVPRAAGPLVEAHLLGFQGDLYASSIRIDFLERLRGVERFDSPEQLTAQIHQDLERVRRLVEGQDR